MLPQIRLKDFLVPINIPYYHHQLLVNGRVPRTSQPRMKGTFEHIPSVVQPTLQGVQLGEIVDGGHGVVVFHAELRVESFQSAVI